MSDNFVGVYCWMMTKNHLTPTGRPAKPSKKGDRVTLRLTHERRENYSAFARERYHSLNWACELFMAIGYAHSVAHAEEHAHGHTHGRIYVLVDLDVALEKCVDFIGPVEHPSPQVSYLLSGYDAST